MRTRPFRPPALGLVRAARAGWLCVLLAPLAGACGSTPRRAPTPDPAQPSFADESGGPGLLGRLLGRDAPQAPPEPTPFERYEGSRPKALTVPTDTVNALKLMAQDWVLAARERGPRVRRSRAGGYVKEYNTFSDKYTLEIERADDEDEATLIGYVFLDSTHMETAHHATESLAEQDTAYEETERKLRMTFHLYERWEFSDLAEEYVFNRVWELARVQYRPKRPPVRAAPAPGPPVQPPQATPHQ